MSSVPPLPSPQHGVTGQNGKADSIWFQYWSALDRYVRALSTDVAGAITRIIAGTGLTGGGTTGDVTVSLANTAVTAGVYGGAGKRTGFTVDAQGRLSAASDAALTASEIGAEPADATLTALAGLDSTPGIVVETGSDAFAKRTLAAPAAGLAITNPSGAAGNPTFALANDLSAVEALSGTGIARRTGTDAWSVGTTVAVNEGGTGATSASGTALDNITGFAATGLLVRTAAGTYAFRSIGVPAAGISITNADGVAGAPTLALANDLAALEGLGGTGLARRTGTDAWSVGTTVAITEGGTGIASYTIGDLLYASGTTTLSKLADIATGNALISGGVGVAPAWGKIDLTAHITGRLAFANIVQLAARTVVCNPTNATGDADVAQGTANQVLITNSAGTGVGFGPVNLAAAAAVTGALAEANGGTNQSTYTAGDLLQASAANTLGKLAAVATGNALISGGVGAASSWGKIGLTTHISGTLAVGNGGTGGSSASGTLLDNITGFASTGILVRTASGTYAFRTLTAPAAGITVSNGDGVSGNPTLALANDLSALEALSSTGYPKRTGTDTWALSATIPNADLTNSSVTVAGKSVSLGSSATVASTDLSDVSTGTWTPAVTTDGTVGTPAYSVQNGSYERIGRTVIARFNIQMSGWTGSPTGNVFISGLPVASANTANDNGHAYLTLWVVAASICELKGVIVPNASSIGLRFTPAGGSTSGAGSASAVTIGATAILEGFCIYHT